MIGARGTIATTVAVGLHAARRGLIPLEGLLTETPPFQPLDLAPAAAIEVGGCDLRHGDLAEALRDSVRTVGVFPPPLVEAVAEPLSNVPVTRGILRGGGESVRALAGDEVHAPESARDAVARIAADLRSFAGGEPAVMVNVASTEPLLAREILEWPRERFERALDEDDARIPASTLYALAAIETGTPYVNFTPSTGGSVPAVVEIAREKGVPLAGRDGKTGETLVKTALAPMFAMRALPVEGWYGANILGNTDGLVLADPTNKASKVATKAGVLEQILGYAPAGDVRIDYFEPLRDHKVAWDFIQFRGWGGHRMRMQFTWEGTDSVLAAPLVVDLARLVDLARRRGESGHIPQLALFFKHPEGTEEMNLQRQYDTLLAWATGEG
jgi:myo-inositol-1-phosphate synthase